MSLARLIKKQNLEKKDVKKYPDKSKGDPSQKTVSNIEKNKISVEIFKRESMMENVKIKSIDYSVMSQDFIEKQSVCEILNINKNKDLINTTDDPRLGTIEKDKLCSTCEKTNEECPGHLGIIRLPVSIIHPFFRITAMKVLQCVCNKCKKILMSEKYIQESEISGFTGFSRLSRIAEQSKDGKIKCTNGCPSNPIFKPQKAGLNETRGMVCVKKIGKKEIPLVLSVETISSIFEFISEKEASLLGFLNNHPKNFIVNFIPVIPLSARPYVVRDKEVKDDYITTTYTDIISKKIESFQKSSVFENTDDLNKKEECYERIIYLYDHLIQNCDQTHRRSPSDICKAISDRIVGKESLIRGNMMGKRADFTGRTVLGPNKSLSFGSIAPPIAMMKKLTVPERITVYNLEYCLQISKEGKIDYLCPSKGVLEGRKLKYDREKHNLNIGDRIGRYSENGDIAIFNRQPTLHKQSMLGYECDFQNKLSVGIHLASTKGHQADFDGDEGNIHMLQSVPSQVEGRILMSAKRAMMSVSSPAPVEGLVINGQTGAYLLTRDEVILTESQFQKGLDYVFRYTKNDYVKTNLVTLQKRIEKFSNLNKFSGKAICSVLFPEDFVYNYIENNKIIKIRNGILVEGTLTGAQVGPQSGSIVQSLWKRYGPDIAASFITNGSFLFNWFSEFYGFTIALKDITPTSYNNFKEFKKKEILQLNMEIINLPKLQKDANETDIDMREIETLQKIENTKNIIQKTFFEKHLDLKSPLYVMLNSKAKGSETDVSRSSCSLFQLIVNDTRPLKLSTKGKRWLPTFSVNDNSIFSRGFCSNSYLEGLDPDEFFVSAQTGRIGVIATAVKTANLGAMQRKMTKAQQDLVVQYDGSVRSNNNIIFQFNYGAGFSASEAVYSTDSNGIKLISFVNIRELCSEINTEYGFPDIDISNKILEEFDKINSKYGDEKITETETEEVELNINDLENYKEILIFDDEDIPVDIEMD